MLLLVLYTAVPGKLPVGIHITCIRIASYREGTTCNATVTSLDYSSSLSSTTGSTRRLFLLLNYRCTAAVRHRALSGYSNKHYCLY